LLGGRLLAHYFYTTLLTKYMAQNRQLYTFLDTKTGKLRNVHPSLKDNKKWLSARGLIVPPVAKQPPAPAKVAEAAEPVAYVHTPAPTEAMSYHEPAVEDFTATAPVAEQAPIKPTRKR
jgi:hypothetical protein